MCFSSCSSVGGAIQHGHTYGPSQHSLNVLLQRQATPASCFIGTVQAVTHSICPTWQGACFARHPWRTIGVAALIMAVFALGLLRFRVETDPQRLWVGPSSRAAREKAAYEV